MRVITIERAHCFVSYESLRAPPLTQPHEVASHKVARKTNKTAIVFQCSSQNHPNGRSRIVIMVVVRNVCKEFDN